MKKIAIRSLAVVLAVFFCLSPLTAAGFEMPSSTKKADFTKEEESTDFKAVETLFVITKTLEAIQTEDTICPSPLPSVSAQVSEEEENSIEANEKVYFVNAPLLGDVNNDGKVSEEDFALLQQYINDWSVTLCLENADFNADGKVNNKDLGLIQKYLLENGDAEDPDKPEDGGENSNPKPGGIPELPEDPFND